MQKARYFLILGILLLAVAVLFLWMGFHAPSESAAKRQDTPDSGNARRGGSPAERLPDPRPAAPRDAAAATDNAEIRFDVRTVSKTQPDPETGFELRAERRELSVAVRVETLRDLPEGYHNFTTAAVKAKALVKYGYFEIQCRPMKSKASSAFWFYRDTPEEWTEIDVFEICGEGDKWKNTYNMNAHVFRTPTEKKHFQRPGKWKAPFDFADGYHTYALEWNKEAVKWWVDGKVVHEMKNTHWHQPLHMLFDSETFPEWFGLPDKATLPATFSIEYVRSWSRPDDN